MSAMQAMISKKVSWDSLRNNLACDLSFYEKFSEKLLGARLSELCTNLRCLELLGASAEVTGTYYPWGRAFEIGFKI
jgi:hypothetical protein